MNEQLSLFDTLWETYKIKKPIRLIELFAGYGSQHLALKYLGANFESWKICEWALKSIQAYKDLHCGDDNTDYSANLTREQVIDFLFERGVSADYNKPMTREQIVRMGELRERECYNNIIATHNLVSVCNVHGKDLNIENKDQYEYIMTYSFPCQDLSLAGKRQLMKKGSGTRSGLLWEVERILHELKADNALPQILLMENVTQVHGINSWEDFEAWKKALAGLGYCNFWQDLIATDYGVPQTRDRTFMVSILGDYNYNFPKPIKLEKRLRDLLEEDVPEKYFLSEQMINQIKHWKKQQDPFRGIDKPKKVSPTITARGAGENHSGMILISETTENMPTVQVGLKRGYACSIKTEETETDDIDILGNYSKSDYNGTMIVGKNGSAPTVRENHGQVTAIPIKNATKKGYLLAEEGDGIDISTRMETHRGTVQKGMAQTLSTMGGANTGVVVRNGK